MDYKNEGLEKTEEAYCEDDDIECGRGPFMISMEEDYAAFSASFFDGYDRS
jgi:hypothetical protein